MNAFITKNKENSFDNTYGPINKEQRSFQMLGPLAERPHKATGEGIHPSYLFIGASVMVGMT